MFAAFRGVIVVVMVVVTRAAMPLMPVAMVGSVVPVGFLSMIVSVASF